MLQDGAATSARPIAAVLGRCRCPEGRVRRRPMDRSSCPPARRRGGSVAFRTGSARCRPRRRVRAPRWRPMARRASSGPRTSARIPCIQPMSCRAAHRRWPAHAGSNRASAPVKCDRAVPRRRPQEDVATDRCATGLAFAVSLARVNPRRFAPTRFATLRWGTYGGLTQASLAGRRSPVPLGGQMARGAAAASLGSERGPATRHAAEREVVGRTATIRRAARRGVARSATR